MYSHNGIKTIIPFNMQSYKHIHKYTFAFIPNNISGVTSKKINRQQVKEFFF